MPRKDSFGDLSPKERAELGDRIRVLVEAAGTQAQAAAISDVSVQQLGRFMRAANAPSLMPLARLACATGLSLDWVALGIGPRYRERSDDNSGRPTVINRTLLTRVLEVVLDVHEQNPNALRAAELARIGAREYEAIALTASTRADERLLLKAMRARLRREIEDAGSPQDGSEGDQLSEVRRKG